jgi:hypothetical protein
MQVREQILNILRAQSLAIARHIRTAMAKDFADAFVIRRQPAERRPSSASDLRRSTSHPGSDANAGHVPKVRTTSQTRLSLRPHCVSALGNFIVAMLSYPFSPGFPTDIRPALPLQ